MGMLYSLYSLLSEVTVSVAPISASPCRRCFSHCASLSSPLRDVLLYLLFALCSLLLRRRVVFHRASLSLSLSLTATRILPLTLPFPPPLSWTCVPGPHPRIPQHLTPKPQLDSSFAPELVHSLECPHQSV